ncbi:unannotated protein [freshwater metagenome]|uniref:Unannotated protein n=1 Tax=freshwater metagenome TaxID=449393 RepID=A0A6J6YQR9_9ZZZZ
MKVVSSYLDALSLWWKTKAEERSLDARAGLCNYLPLALVVNDFA